MKRRLLSMLLVLSMVLSMVPVAVSAEIAPVSDVHTPGTHGASHVCQKCGASAQWEAWNSGTSLPKSGHYYLTQNVTTAQTVITDNLCLCLNGYTVDGPDNGKTLAAVTANLFISIQDCTAVTEASGQYKAGSLTGAVNGSAAGGAFYIGGTSKNKLYLYDGIIEGNQASGGGAVCIANGNSSSYGQMYMYGGQIRNNLAKDSTGAWKAGGALQLGNYGRFFHTGGVITGNEAKLGGGIYTGSNVTLAVKNASVTGNHATENGGGVYFGTGTLSLQQVAKITGNTAVDKSTANNLYLPKDYAGATANALTQGAQIGVTLAQARIDAGQMYVTTVHSGNHAEYFQSDSDVYEAVKENNQILLKVKPFQHEHCACGVTDCTEASHGGKVSYEKWDQTGSLPKHGAVCLTKDVTLSAQTVLDGDLTICLHGKTITGFDGGRMIAANGGYQLTISDCTAAYDAAGNYTAGQLTGATHSASKNNSGGAIFIGEKDTLYLYDGILTGNSAKGGGGALQVGGQLYMYGGEISNNKALDGKEGGGIGIGKTGKAYLYGGTITGNEARVGAGIYCLGSELVLGGVKIVSNKAEKAGGVFMADNCAVKLEGDLQILGNSAADKASNLVLPDKVTLQVGTVGANAKVAVDAAAFRYISGETADCTAAFQSDAAALVVVYQDGKLYMNYAGEGHKHCLCAAAATGCDHSAINWAPWEKSDALPSSGNYYLTKDVTVSAQTSIDGTQLNLCLNGHTIKVEKGRAFYLKGNAKLNVTDCTGKGIITGAKSAAIMTENKAESKAVVNIFGGTFKDNSNHTAGGALAIQGGATLNVYGGVFENNSAIGQLKTDAAGNPALDANGSQQADNAIGGGAISMYGETTVLNIYGGTFKNNKAVHVEVKDKDGKISNKGGYGIVYIQGTANVYGGSFTGGEALLGGAFFVTGEKAELNIQAVQITGNTAKGGGAIVLQSGATVNVMGGNIANNTCGGAGGGAVYVSDATLHMTGGKVAGNASPGNGGALYISEGTANLLGGEISSNTATANGGAVYVNRGTLVLNGAALKNNRSEKSNGGAVYGAGAKLIQIDKGEISGSKANNGAGIYATQNVIGDQTLYSHVVVNGGTISGNAATTNGGGIMLVGQGSVLDLNGGVITGNSAKNGAGVLAQTSSTVNFADGNITGNKASVGGGGLYISVNTKLNMTGGTITKNDSANNGGGMLVQRGTAVIKGGTISNNTATTAAGVYFAGAKADIYDVAITGNTARKNCGGVLLGANSYTENGVKKIVEPVVTMHGGKISGNAAPKANAGGVLLQSKGSTFNLKGGAISNNTCAVGGGAIYVAKDSILNMTGGTISGNEAKQAGAIFCQKGEANITGGKIYGNKATALAGALLVNGDIGVMTVKNVDIHSNTAPSAGAVEVQNFGTINMENCKVRDNSSVNMAGGIYIDKVSFGNLKDVQIYNNNCTDGGGGGMAVAVGATVKADNITVENNRATGIGGGIYNRGRLELNGSVVRANSTTGNGGGIGTFKTSAIPLSKDAGLFVKNSQIIDNRAVKGAGLYLHVGCISELADVTVEKNVAEAEGSGIFSGGQTTLTNVTVTGNTSQSDLYALYFDASLYDGHTYYTGKKVLQGKIVVKDNQGGDAYLGEGGAIAIPGEGLTEGTYLPITLHSGLLTRQVIGIYNYEGEDLQYLITAGNRSVTDPEQDGTEGKLVQSGGNDWILYGAIGLFAVAVIAAVVILLAKKKKKTPAVGKE